jgi:hypothetical protein
MKLQMKTASESDMLDMVANPVRFVRKEEMERMHDGAATVTAAGGRHDGP